MIISMSAAQANRIAMNPWMMEKARNKVLIGKW